MVPENEIISLLIGCGALVFMLANLAKLQRMPAYLWLLAAFGSFFCGWVLTVLEGYCWPEICNLLEHIAYTLSSLLLAVWALRFAALAKDQHP
ncbi:MAG: hypothetical protein JRF33_23685 [Deltaproteobacteria bacterium]|nr:hypothetical protein [Deltaproteobacteria bacterium]